MAQAAPALIEKRQSIRLEVPGKLPAAMAEADRLREVLVTLIENASLHSPPGTVIPLSLLATDSSDGQWVSVSIRDFGKELTPEELGRVFQSPEHDGGPKSGLARVKELAEAFKGQVWVGSEVGGGSTVTVLIPTARD
jgi:signal transduction histidine kinase